MCNCKVGEIIFGIVILVFTFWETAASQWIVAIAAALLIIHALACKNLASCAAPQTSAGKASSGKRK